MLGNYKCFYAGYLTTNSMVELDNLWEKNGNKLKIGPDVLFNM